MGKDLGNTDHCLLLCNGGSCKRQGSEEMIRELRARIRMQERGDRIHTIKTHCMGHCHEGPYICVLPDNVWYKEIDAKKGIEVVDEHLLKGEPLEEHLLFRPGMERIRTDEPTLEEKADPIPFERKAEGDPFLRAKARFKDQELHPMLKVIFERKAPRELHLPGTGVRQELQEELPLRFDGRTVMVEANGQDMNFRIAPLPKNSSETDEGCRIRTVEAFFHENGQEDPGFQFRDEKGRSALIILEKSNDRELWKHLLRTYFRQDSDPGLQVEGKTKDG